MGLKQQIIAAFNVEDVAKIYEREIVEITDLKPKLKTKGHVLLIRGDKALYEEADISYKHNAKFWMFDNILSSDRIQEQLIKNPGKKLFDGVGFSAFDALCHFTKVVDREAVVVMTREFLPNISKSGGRIEVIHADMPFEQGYVAKQYEILKTQGDGLIPLHQALYGPSAMAPIGNQVAGILDGSFSLPIYAYQSNPQFHDIIGIKPDVALWVMAGGSALYGIGKKLKQRFPDMRNVLVEPSVNRTIDDTLDLSDTDEIKKFARSSLKDYYKVDWEQEYSGMMPLHMHKASRYILANWSFTGEAGIDEVINVQQGKVGQIMRDFWGVEEDYYWTNTTALTLAPAIELAKEGKNVVIMAYGGFVYRHFRNLDIRDQLGMVDPDGIISTYRYKMDKSGQPGLIERVPHSD